MTPQSRIERNVANTPIRRWPRTRWPFAAEIRCSTIVLQCFAEMNLDGRGVPNRIEPAAQDRAPNEPTGMELGTTGCLRSRRAGFPAITVPAGLQRTFMIGSAILQREPTARNGSGGDGEPLKRQAGQTGCGATSCRSRFSGSAFSEPMLLRIAATIRKRRNTAVNQRISGRWRQTMRQGIRFKGRGKVEFQASELGPLALLRIHLALSLRVKSPAFTLAGVVLRAGRSSRMGPDKALLMVDGQPLWLRQYELLAAAGAGWNVSLGSIRTGLVPSDVRRVADAMADCGPLGGIVAAWPPAPALTYWC